MSLKEPDLRAALGVAAPEIGEAVREASAALTRLGIRHALCGGIAVSSYATPRTTQDVDFLVGEEAFDHAGAIASVKAGVPSRVGSVVVDTVPLVPDLLALDDLLASAPRSDGVPIVPADALIAMKLVAGRLKDQADIVALLNSGSVDPRACRRFLVERGFQKWIALYDSLVARPTE